MRRMNKMCRTNFSCAMSPRSLIILTVLAAALIAALAGGVKERRALAAAAQQQPTPTPPPGTNPDYSKVDDILSGRRHLLRTDDVIVTSVTGGYIPIETKQILQTANSLPVKNVAAADFWNPSLRTITGPLTGRVFNLPHDVLVTAYTVEDDGRPYFMIDNPLPVEDWKGFVDVGTQKGSVINSFMMADFNEDGYDDLVLNWTCSNEQSCSNQNGLAIVTANDPNNFNAGLRPAQKNYNTTAIYNMAVSDFNGDGQPDIIGVEAGADGTGLRLAYHTVDPKTFAISDGVYLPVTNPLSTAGKMVRISAAGGRFTDAFHDQLVVAYYTDEYYPANNGVRLVVIDFDASMQAQLGPVLDTNSIPTNGQTVIKVQTGRFDWSSQYDQVAVMFALWGEPQPNGIGRNTKWLEVDTINPKDLSINRNKLWEFSAEDCGFDFTVGNFDRTQLKPNSQETERDPDLQLALVFGSCEEGYKGVQLYNVDPASGFELSHPGPSYSLPNQDDPNPYNYRISVGDTQGRSLVLGEPTKIVIEGATQATAIIAAPPMHVDFMAAVGQTAQSVLNLSAVPDSFNTFFELDSSSTTNSSTTNTTSWSFGAKESVNASTTVGVPVLGELNVEDTFTATQDLKGSTEKTLGSYSGLAVDISEKTGLFDQVSYSDTRFNIYVYPVIGKTVCPANKANSNAECADGDKVPLTIQFSGPDQTSTSTVAGSQIEWYQPPWEYGNVLSYPGSYAQLQKIVPDIDKKSTDLTWLTDTSNITEKTTWSSGTSASQSTSFDQNYSFENDLSVSGSTGIEGVDSVDFGTNIDLSGSFGFSSLNKSSTDLSKSSGIGVNKPGTFRDPFDYGYSVTPYIFGNNPPSGSVDNNPLTGDVQTSGSLQTAFVVDPINGNAGGWWKQAYTPAPDVALNHPTRWVITDQGSGGNCLPTSIGTVNCANLAPSYPDNPWLSEFHNMRGFFISSANAPGQGPQLTTAKAGQKLTLQSRVYNYSLKAMDADSNVHIRFYGMEWNTTNNTPVGSSFLIGEDVLPPLPPFSADADADLNWAYAQTDFDTTNYGSKDLVFWVVVWIQKADGTLAAEITSHGLTTVPGMLTKLGDVPIETVTAGGQTVSYSNNVGFYKSVFHVFAASTSVEPVSLYEPGDMRLGQVKVSERRIKQGQATEVSVLLRTRAKSASGVQVVFYDGDPAQGGRAFDVERIAHIRARDRHEIKVPFRSNACGDHQIFVTVGRGKPYEVTDASRTVRVQCNQPTACTTNCFRAPQYYPNNLWGGLPRGEVWVAGTATPVSTRNVRGTRFRTLGLRSAQRRRLHRHRRRP